MSPAGFTHVGVVGGGLMGSGIAEAVAVAGLPVVVLESDPSALARSRARVEASVSRAESRGHVDDAAGVLGRLRFVARPTELVGCDLVIEAIVEDEAAKRALFAEIDGVLDPAVVFASNTSSIPIARLGATTSRPDRFIGMHFFNPVPVLPLVEVIPSLDTSAATTEAAETFVSATLGKTAIVCADRAGFVVNALLIPFIVSAVRMLENGHASAEDIDRAFVLGAAHPLGPLALADLIGLDTVGSIASSLAAEYGDAAAIPPQLLSRMVESGRLGRKTGRGFFSYGDPRAERGL